MQKNRTSRKIVGFVLRTGEPPARVPHAKTVHRTVLAPLLRFALVRGFRRLRSATKGAAFGIRKPLKRLDRNF